jgi:hypothetical protein
LRAAKIASWITLVIVAVVFGLWWRYVRAPTPTEVCDHIVEVTLAETAASGTSPESEAAIIERIKASCIQHKLDKIQLRGRIRYADYAKCVMAETTLAGVDAC